MEQQSRISLLPWSLLLILGFIVFTLIYSFSQIPLFFQLGEWFTIPCLMVACGVLCGCYYLFERIYRRFNPQPVGTVQPLKGLFCWTGGGMIVGVAYFAILAIVMYATGCFRIVSVQFDGLSLLTWLLGFLMVAIGEEIMFRGIIFRLIDERWNVWAALVVSGLIFGFVHISNGNATVWSSVAIAIEAGLLLGAAYKYSGNLWFPIGIHWAWNYTQGCVLGCNVSGNALSTSIIKPEFSGSDLITGGAFGPEASVPAVVVGFALSCILIYKIVKRQGDGK